MNRPPVRMLDPGRGTKCPKVPEDAPLRVRIARAEEIRRTALEDYLHSPGGTICTDGRGQPFGPSDHPPVRLDAARTPNMVRLATVERKPAPVPHYGKGVCREYLIIPEYEIVSYFGSVNTVPEQVQLIAASYRMLRKGTNNGQV